MTQSIASAEAESLSTFSLESIEANVANAEANMAAYLITNIRTVATSLNSDATRLEINIDSDPANSLAWTVTLAGTTGSQDVTLGRDANKSTELLFNLCDRYSFYCGESTDSLSIVL